MITIKNKQAIEKMATAGSLLAQVFEKLTTAIQPGITTLAIDTIIAQELADKGLISSMKGYMGYRYVSCISLNNEVVHGIPSAKVVKAGDLVKVDVCASWKGYCADMARCFYVGGPVPEPIQRLVRAAQESLDAGIEQMQPGRRLGDVSAAIERKVTDYGFGVVQDFAGHGVGRKMHEDPEILNYGKPGTGPVLQVGMAFALEPMITEGAYPVYVEADGWTVKTKDNSLAAHVEDTVVITQNGPRILTRITS